MKIIYTGGGTMGSVSPLIAIQSAFAKATADRHQLKPECLWIGTKDGVEKEVVQKAGIKFKAIASGKWRRYFDLQNIVDILNVFIGWWQAYFIIFNFSPDVIVSAGGFVAVPVVWAAWILGVPCIIHQQDVEVGLANKLMAPAAARITVALEKSLDNFPSKKTILVGNPVRGISKIQETISKEIPNSRFQIPDSFNNDLPTVLIMGGGTGAQAINELIWQSLDELKKFCNIIHLTGKNKNSCQSLVDGCKSNYKVFEFLNQDDIYSAMQKSDLVVSRAGMSALTELAYFSKPTIIIPIPDSHQEKNAEYFAEKNAGIYLKQNELDKEKFVREIKDILEKGEKRNEKGQNMHKIFIDYSGNKIIEIIKNLKK